jgi:mannan polymerase complexes MNN9 subunit
MHWPNRTYSRILIFVLCVFLLWLFSRIFQLRQSSWSCRTVSSCLGIGSHETYLFSKPEFSDTRSYENILHDGTLHYHRVSNNTNPSILFLALNENEHSWSSDFRETRRTAYDFMDVISSTKLDLANASLAIQTASLDQYHKIIAASMTLPFARVDISHHAETKPSGNSYENRHSPATQLGRRSALAVVRNELMLRALEDEKHIVWLDADVVFLSEGIVQTMIGHPENIEDAGIITARCHQNQMDNYDKNAWRVGDGDVQGTVSNEERAISVQKLVETRVMVDQAIMGTDDSEIIPLDSVGGTILYLRARLVREGVVFPHFNIVGTTWKQPGWIGVETEGLCYMAKGLAGGGCYVLGGKHYVRHSDWG